MEVHHHPDLHHKKKKWKEYFLEFLMIFLAVTMGFFAESIRESQLDREKEKQSIESLVRCLASDTTQLNTIIHSNLMVAKYLDSLIMLKNVDLTSDENKRKFYEYGTVGFVEDWYFKTNDAAMEQLKSSGLLRLIKNQNIIDSIFGYELKNKVTVAQESDNYFLFKESMLHFKSIMDFSLFRDTSVVSFQTSNKFFTIHYKKTNHLPITSDKEKLNALFSNASMMATALEAYAQYMQEQKEYGISLITLLKNKYYLE